MCVFKKKRSKNTTTRKQKMKHKNETLGGSGD